MKKRISILLALSMILSCTAPTFAAEDTSAEKFSQEEQQIVISETAGISSEKENLPKSPIIPLQDVPLPEIQAELLSEPEPVPEATPTVVSGLADEDTDTASLLAAEETTLSEDEKYLLNIVLFTTDDTTDLDNINGQLDELGIREIQPVFTDDNGNPKSIGKKHEIWYRAYTDQDANTVIDSLTKLDGIIYAEPEYVYSADSIGEPDETEQKIGWIYDSLLKLKSDFWWYTLLNHDFAPGKGTVVAVIDTGVDYTHEDLAANMWVNTAELYGTEGVDDDGNGYIDDIYGADVTASGKKAGNPMDDNGHGTHVSGIIGMSANGIGGVGLAYGTKIMAVKAGQSTGSFASSHIAKAINYAHMMGADVINMSFGGTMKSYLIESALEDAFADCVLVASAGNDGLPTTDALPYKPYYEDIYPAGYSYVLGVMATDISGKLAGFSNWDYMPNANCEYELTAPGVDIYSTLPGNRYAKWSGTSMAAPCVSAAAAILRSNFSDKDMYSARFIMGQLTSATKGRTGFTAPQGEYYSYPALNIYDSINYLPKPNVTVKDAFLMDNKELSETNDGDAVVDAGETIDLGVLVRNQWGLTGDITIKADAISVGGVANPYIEFITDEVTLEPVGTFQEGNNGFVYNDSYLEKIDNPIQFKVSEETPNDAEICINITVTTTNGYDENDTDVYTVKVGKTFRVQSGRGISGTLTEDTTLTNNYLWVIENSLYVPEGVTLTIEPGTKVQFYSSDYEDAYGGKTIPNIVCQGTLNAIGTEDEPIEMYPGAGFEKYCVEIAGDGIETLKYCTIINPRLGYTGQSNTKTLDVVDHCQLIQNTPIAYYRYVSGSEVKEYYDYYYKVNNITNTKISGVREQHSSFSVYNISFCANNIENCIFENCRIRFSGTNSSKYKIKNSVLQSGIDFGYGNPIPNHKETFDENIYTYDGAKSKYVLMKFNNSFRNGNDYYYPLAKAMANSVGGTLLCINDDEEMNFVKNTMHDIAESTREDGNNDNIYKYVVTGYSKDSETGEYKWEDGSEYPVSWSIADRNKHGYIYFASYPSGINTYWYNTGSFDGSFCDYILELPVEKSDDEIKQALESFDTYQYLFDNIVIRDKTNNAILNPVLNTDVDLWSKFTAQSMNISYSGELLDGNYWGTENKTLINKMIIDADDFAGTYNNIIEDPILTLESESLADIYPFVTKIYMTDSDGNIVSNASQGETYNVHVLFNRDMDEDTQPMITYGGEEPYTDYSVDGSFVSPREWVGTTKISPILTGGTMYWRTKGGCAADDKWLVCGEDTIRFSFNISSTGVLAMLLNADGGANKIELSWAQNDYETLAGYNLYRSQSAGSGFKKINTSVLTDTSYTDTDVQPGVTYYYYFKVVNTDGNEESSVSNTASAAPIDNIFPVISHAPVEKVKAGNQITISATATDNIGVESVKLYYRKVGDSNFTEKSMTSSTSDNLYVAVIPASYVTASGVEYYITASDADGNVSYSGTAQIPNVITVDSTAYISGITPSSVNISGGRTVSILGGNLTQDMTLKVGGNEISEKSFIDAGRINFIAPALSSGSYAVTLTAPNGEVLTSPTVLSYIDSESVAQIPTSMTMTSGEPYTIPFYATAGGDIISVHAEIDLPTSDFTSVKVEKADANANFTLDYSYTNGTLKIGCIGTSNINTADSALINIIVTPKVSEDKQYTIKLHDVSFNGVKVNTIISGDVHIKPSYILNVLVKYYMGTDNFISNALISASGTKGTTNESGQVELNVPQQSVTVTAQRTDFVNAVTAYDASLVLQSAIDKITLTDNQKKAADVDGNGIINEYDAALILQMAVRKIDVFPTSNTWIFSPSSINKTLTATNNNSVTFTAVSIGDVDGSYRGDAQ